MMLKRVPTVYLIALCMGAWIEITNMFTKGIKVVIALCMGAWIEMILDIKGQRLRPKSHSVWVRGLKCVNKWCLVLKINRTLYGCVD